MRDAKNLGNHELIGLNVTVMKGELTEHEGVVIDKTMNTFRLFSDVKRVMVPKEGRDFIFHLKDGQHIMLKGKNIKFRPEDRTKKVK